MTTKPENPPAFPVLHSIDGNWVREPISQYCGMTLLDYAAIHLKQPISENQTVNKAIVAAKRDDFAAAALTGLLASGKRVQINGVDMATDSLAYELADAMLKAREATNE